MNHLALTVAIMIKKKAQLRSKLPTTIDEYIEQFEPNLQAILQKIRKTIQKLAPNAKEVISYRMPAFKQSGILVYFAAWKNHIGFYPPVSGDEVLEKLVARYANEKGNLLFPLDQPIPYDLITRIVKLRVKQDLAKVEAKLARRRR